MWALVAADLLSVLLVYSLVAPARLHAVEEGGLHGGLSRTLVQLDFPHVAGAAIPLALLALDVLPRRAWLVGAPAIALCAVLAWPGAIDQNDLEAKPVNVLPALGVALVLGLTIAAARASGTSFAPRRSGDPFRLVVAAAVVLVSLPWIFADAGVHLPQGLFLTTKLYAEPGQAPTAAVHLGFHHGLMGALLVLSALLLSRARLVHAGLRKVFALLVSLMLVYGAANMANDFWHEQIVKRGWTSWGVPSALQPGVHPTWAVMLATTVLVYLLGFGRPRPEAAYTAVLDPR